MGGQKFHSAPTWTGGSDRTAAERAPHVTFFWKFPWVNTCQSWWEWTFVWHLLKTLTSPANHLASDSTRSQLASRSILMLRTRRLLQGAAAEGAKLCFFFFFFFSATTNTTDRKHYSMGKHSGALHHVGYKVKTRICRIYSVSPRRAHKKPPCRC